MTLDHAMQVLGGIIPGNKENLLYAIQHLSEEHFAAPRTRTIFRLLRRYHEVSGGVIQKTPFIDMLERKKVEAARVLVFEELFTEIENLDVSEDLFRYSIEALKDLRSETLTGEAFATGFDILTRGQEVNGEQLEGHRAAREFITREFGDIDQIDNLESAPEGDMRRESAEMLEEYLSRKSGQTGRGILTGIAALDEVTSGAQRGELWLACAYTGQGKSQLSAQTAWHAATQQGRNVFFATSETSRQTVRRRLAARHSREPQFGLPDGLNSKEIKNGTLSDEHEAIYQDVLHDIDTNPDYGSIYIAQIPRGANLSYLSARMMRQQMRFDIDFCVVDYLALLHSERRRDSEREEFNEILRNAKMLATSFNSGIGVPIFSPWQLKQTAYTEAIKTGLYGLASLSDTSEAEKTADVILTLLRLDETPQEAYLQVLKNRDGEIPDPMVVDVDYRSTYLGDKTGASLDLDSFLD